MNDSSILHNVRIVDFTWVLAGPYGTRLLADFGAEVIKVQPVNAPETGDAFERGYYAAWNRNKRSITLDMNRPEGISLAKKLIANSDVVIENFTPRVMANWGLTYDDLKRIRPDIIMVSMSAFGQTGPKRDRAGFAPTIQAASGLTGLMSFPGGEPLGPGFSLADHVVGLYAAMAVLAALEERRKTGEGQYIDISQQEAMMSLLGGEFLEYQRTGDLPVPPDTAGLEGKDAADLFHDPHLRERRFFVERPDIGKLIDANPMRLSETPAEYRRPAPAPGEDNGYVFNELLVKGHDDGDND